MLTQATTNVDAPRAVMLTIAEIAAQNGVSKQAVSRKVKQLVEKHGLVVERDGNGRVSRVNVAEYDHLRGRFDDPSKTQAPRAPEAPQSESYDEALRQKTWTEAERARLRLEEERRQLVRVQEVADAVAKCSEDLVRIVKSLINKADDHAVVVGREGANGLRHAYKAVTDAQLSEMADALARLGALDRGSVEEAPPDPQADLLAPSKDDPAVS